MTAQGRELQHELAALAAAARELTEAALTPEEKGTLMTALQKIAEIDSEE